MVDLPSDPEDDPEDDESDSPDEVAKLRAEVARLEAENQRLNAKVPAPMDVGQAAPAPGQAMDFSFLNLPAAPAPAPAPAPAAPMIVRMAPAAAQARRQAGRPPRRRRRRRSAGPRGVAGQRHAGRAAGEAGTSPRRKTTWRSSGQSEPKYPGSALRRRRRFHRRVEAHVRHRREDGMTTKMKDTAVQKILRRVKSHMRVRVSPYSQRREGYSGGCRGGATWRGPLLSNG